MIAIAIAAGTALIASVIADRKKTLQALQIAIKRISRLLPAFVTMLAAVSLALTLLPEEVIARSMGGENIYLSALGASVLGSITLMPGFIAFPLAGILRAQGVAYMVLAAFTTSLMIVGVLTYPVEKEYFGIKVTVLRNVFSFLISLLIALATGAFFGELW